MGYQQQLSEQNDFFGLLLLVGTLIDLIFYSFVLCIKFFRITFFGLGQNPIFFVKYNVTNMCTIPTSYISSIRESHPKINSKICQSKEEEKNLL